MEFNTLHQPTGRLSVTQIAKGRKVRERRERAEWFKLSGTILLNPCLLLYFGHLSLVHSLSSLSAIKLSNAALASSHNGLLSEKIKKLKLTV